MKNETFEIAGIAPLYPSFAKQHVKIHSLNIDQAVCR